jgi:Tfp pilus assembly protein PilP
MKPSLTAAVAAVVLLSGCSTRAPEAPLRVTPPGPAAPVAAVSGVSEAPPAPAYAYVPFNKRDPFRPVSERLPAPVVACDQPLCRYALDELKLAGIISGTSRPVAVLESPKGKGYPVYSGTRVGKHGGVVKRVLRDAIVVAEYWPTPDGQLRASEVVLRVSPEAPLALEE